LSDVGFLPVPVGSKDLRAYSLAAGDDVVARLRHRAAGLAGARLLHISSTPYGGGVAEHLGTHLPLLRDLGLEAEWQVLTVPDEFLQVTKAIHNGLQGMDVAWTARMEHVYLDTLLRLAPALVDSWDFVIVHDPQPAALLTHLQDEGRFGEARWVWRCHIDLSTVNPQVWEFLHPHVERYAATIWTMEDDVPATLSRRRPVAVFPPGIDPLAGKNIDLDSGFARSLCRVYGVDPDRPVVAQVSRFDPWKDPVGVIRSFDPVHEAMPDAQLFASRFGTAATAS
jgi:trehalose synthase